MSGGDCSVCSFEDIGIEIGKHIVKDMLFLDLWENCYFLFRIGSVNFFIAFRDSRAMENSGRPMGSRLSDWKQSN